MSGLPPFGNTPNAGSPELMQILSARQALRVLDASIARTEQRLRNLPNMVPASIGVPGPVGGGSGRNGSLKNKFFGVERGGLNVGPMGIDKGGIGLNKGFMRFGGKAVSAMIGAHIVASVGTQIMDLAERDRDMALKGASRGERIAAAGSHMAGSFIEQAANISGASSIAEMALRGGGFTKEASQEGVRDVFEAIKTGGRSIQRRNKALRDATAKAGAEVRKQYNDAYVFLDSWFPEDFDVAGEIDMKDLRSDMRRLNAGRLEAWLSDEGRTAFGKAVRDSRGD